MLKFIRVVGVATVVLTVLALPVQNAFACFCMPPQLAVDALNASDAAFAGKVVRVVSPNQGPILSSADPVFVTIQVSTVWKGPETAQLTLQTARDGASCGYTFEQGQEYLVYASLANGTLTTHLCSGTQTLAAARADVAVLGAGKTITAAQPLDTSWILPLSLAGIIILAAFIIFGLGFINSQRSTGTHG